MLNPLKSLGGRGDQGLTLALVAHLAGRDVDVPCTDATLSRKVNELRDKGIVKCDVEFTEQGRREAARYLTGFADVLADAFVDELDIAYGDARDAAFDALRVYTGIELPSDKRYTVGDNPEGAMKVYRAAVGDAVTDMGTALVELDEIDERRFTADALSDDHRQILLDGGVIRPVGSGEFVREDDIQPVDVPESVYEDAVSRIRSLDIGRFYVGGTYNDPANATELDFSDSMLELLERHGHCGALIEPDAGSHALYTIFKNPEDHDTCDGCRLCDGTSGA